MGGEEMARIRREMGLTQEALGEELGISKQRVSALERGATEMSLPMAVRVAAALTRLSGGARAVTLDELAGLAPAPAARLPRGLQEHMDAIYAALAVGEGRKDVGTEACGG